MSIPILAGASRPSRRRSAGGGGGGPVPPEIAGSLLWVEADEGLGLVDGAAVHEWASAYGQAGILSTAAHPENNPPAFVANAGDGLPAVRFTEQALAWDEAVENAGACYCAAHIHCTARDGNIFDGTSGSGKKIQALIGTDGAMYMYGNTGYGQVELGGAIPFPDFVTYVWVFNGANSFALRDGAQRWAGSLPGQTCRGITVGSSVAGAVELTGDIRAFIFGRGTPDPAVWDDLLAFWQAKWAAG